MRNLNNKIVAIRVRLDLSVVVVETLLRPSFYKTRGILRVTNAFGKRLKFNKQSRTHNAVVNTFETARKRAQSTPFVREYFTVGFIVHISYGQLTRRLYGKYRSNKFRSFSGTVKTQSTSAGEFEG